MLASQLGRFERFLQGFRGLLAVDGMFTGRFGAGSGCQGSRTCLMPVLQILIWTTCVSAGGAKFDVRFQQIPNPKSCRNTYRASRKQEALNLRQARSSSNLDKYIDAQAVRRGLKAGSKRWRWWFEVLLGQLGVIRACVGVVCLFQLG